jgi:hypothetical protein
MPRGFLFVDRVAGEDRSMTAPLPAAAALFGREGELISLSVATDPKLLEDLLEALASLDFPVNPQLYHRPTEVLVEFPAYLSQVERVREALLRQGFDGGIRVSRPLVRATGGLNAVA